MYLTRRIRRLSELERDPGIVRSEDDGVAEGCEGLRVECEGGVVCREGEPAGKIGIVGVEVLREEGDAFLAGE